MPFERQVVEDGEARERLAALWPLASIPVLVDDAAGLIAAASRRRSSSTSTGSPGSRRLMPAEPAGALQARLWDRIVDGHVMTPMQKIVLTACGREGRGDPVGVEEARAELGRVYELVDRQLDGAAGSRATGFTLADCAAAPALYYARMVERWDEAGLAHSRATPPAHGRPSVARVIDEARPYRTNFPLPWPDWAE